MLEAKLVVEGYWHKVGDAYPTRDWSNMQYDTDGLDGSLIGSNEGIRKQIDFAVQNGHAKDGKVKYFVIERHY
jgi:hypothetical protein